MVCGLHFVSPSPTVFYHSSGSDANSGEEALALVSCLLWLRFSVRLAQCRWSVCGGGAVGMYDETFAKKIPFFKLVNNNNK
jgi:hypothetical protein